MVDYDGGNNNGGGNSNPNGRNEIREEEVFGSVSCRQRIIVDFQADSLIDRDEFDVSVAETEIRENVSEKVSSAVTDVQGPIGRGGIVHVDLDSSIVVGDNIDEILEIVRLAIQGQAGRDAEVEIEEWAVRARRVR